MWTIGWEISYDCNLDIFEMIGNTYELIKELVNKKLLIFKWYHVNKKDTKAPFKPSVKKNYWKLFNNNIVVSQFSLFYFNVSNHFPNRAKKIWPFRLKDVLHGTPSFDTLICFWPFTPKRQKAKKQPSSSFFNKISSPCHHLSICPFLCFCFWSSSLFFFVMHLTSLSSCVASSCCCVSYLFKLLTLPVDVMCFISFELMCFFK